MDVLRLKSQTSSEGKIFGVKLSTEAMHQNFEECRLQISHSLLVLSGV